MLNYIKSCTIILFLSLCFSMSGQDTALWLRYSAISPNGESILFNYKGDIYKVSSAGGEAVPLTMSESYEFNAVWSNDGESIAFASDRYGNFDVFIMPATGGESKRLTFHSTNEIPCCFNNDDSDVLFEAVRQDDVNNVQFPSGVLAELYSVPVNGGRVGQVLTTPAQDADMSHDGKKILFHDRKGYENAWRKHHTSSVTRDIWVYDTELKTYTKLSDFKGEDRNPVFENGSDNFYYLTEASGSFNICKSSLSNSSSTTPVTKFENHPVRFLSISDKNKLCFSYNGEIYTMVEGQEPQKVRVKIKFDGRENIEKIVSVNSSFTETSLSPNGKEFAYVFRGEIFVSSVEHGTTKRITNTPYQERSVSFSPDGRSLVYAAEKNSNWNIYSMSIKRDEEKYFFTSTLLKEEEIVATDAVEFQPAFSPDGKEVAYLENRTTLKVINLESKQSRVVLPAKYNYSYADGDQYYEWSPDSKWFLVKFGPQEDVMHDEVGLIEASGSGTLRNLSQSGYYDVEPKWSLNGKMVVYGSTREADRGENGYPSAMDLYGMFFTQAAFDRFNLSEEEEELLKEKEKKEKEEAEESDSKNDKKSSKDKDEEEEVEDLEFDWDNLVDRKKKLTVNTSEIDDWVLSKEGDKIYYLTKFEKKNNIWETDLKTKETKLFAKIDGKRTSMELSKDGEFFLVLSDGKAMKVEIKEAKVTPISTNGEMVLNTSNERKYIFNHTWRQVRDKFFVQDMQGVDWDFYRSEYEKFLPYINNNYDFAEMLSEMLGELNASHTGSGYRPKHGEGDETASLGIMVDYSHKDDGIKVAEVIKGGPLDKAAIKIKANHIIEKIDGVELSQTIDWYKLLNRKKGKYVLLSVLNPETNERWDEVVKPVSLGKERELLYQRWVKSRQAETKRLSAGKLGYVHVRGMNDASMRTVYEQTLGKYISADALVVDTRFNGGGNLADVLSDFLNGQKTLEMRPHGQYVGSEPYNKWVKPSIVLMGESNYSDAHIFPVLYKHKGVGKLLGMPVPGTGTFVWWETQIDPTIYIGMPMGAINLIGEPELLENNQLEPDMKVLNEPGVVSSGRDQQLEEAIKELMK